MAKIRVNLVTVEKKHGKTVAEDVEPFESVTEARDEMRDYMRAWLDAGWTRQKNAAPLRTKPMTITILSSGKVPRSITCTIVRDTGRRPLSKESQLSE